MSEFHKADSNVPECSLCGAIGKHYFGEMKLPVEGTGEWEDAGESELGEHTFDVVRWTGDFRTLEYWECDECYHESEE